MLEKFAYEPLDTVTVAGTGSDTGSLLDNCTVAVFPAGTLVPNPIWNKVEPPALIVEGVAVNDASPGTTVILNGTDAPAYVPVIVAVTAEETGRLLTVNVVLNVPAGTVTVAGTVIAGLSLLRLMVAPPAGARPFRAAVTLTGYPAMVVLTAGKNPPSNGSVMIVFCNPMDPASAPRTTACELVTAVVVIGKLALVAPPATVTVAGTVIPEPPVKAKVVPPAGAAELNVIVPVLLAPPTISCGEIMNEFTGCKGLNGGSPPPNGRYSGSPIFRICHLSQRVLRRNASPTLAPSSRLR